MVCAPTAPRKGRKKALNLGQIGIGCLHCKSSAYKLKGSTYFPTSISGIYNATMIIQQRHFPVCPSVSAETLCKYNKLKSLTARSASTKEYWVSAAKKLVSAFVLYLSLPRVYGVSSLGLHGTFASSSCIFCNRVWSTLPMVCSSDRLKKVCLALMSLKAPVKRGSPSHAWCNPATKLLQPSTPISSWLR